MSLADLQGLAERSDLEQIEAGASSKLENLIGFFSSLFSVRGGTAPEAATVAVDISR